MSDEHNELPGSRRGGFGWATATVARLLLAHPEEGLEPLVLCCDRRPATSPRPDRLGGVPMVWRRPGRLGRFPSATPRPDVFLAIDYRPNYRIALLQWPRVPLLVWCRDPWGPPEHACLAGLRLPPPHGDETPQGVAPPDHRSFAQVWWLARLLRRPIALRTTDPFLVPRLPAAFGIRPGPVPVLANPIEIDCADLSRSPQPSVLFLGRPDPVKRPWVFAALAREFPEVEFRLAGRNHFSGPGSWRPTPADLPPNLRLLGHLDGEEKRQLLGTSWILVNTSIHEGLPVSFQEALAAQLPVVSTLDSGGLASRFGRFVGTFPGDGLDSVSALSRALRELLDQPAERARLGAAGRAWLDATHRPRHFLAGLNSTLRTLVRRRPTP